MHTRQTVRAPHHHVTYPVAARVTAHVAMARGISEASAHQDLYGDPARRLNLKVATVITALQQSGDRAALAHFLAPIEAAIRGIAAPAESDRLAEQAQVADGDEETAGVRYYRNRTLENAKAYILAIDTQNALGLEERMAVAHEWGLA